MTIEQLAKEIAMFKDDCVDPEDMLIDYDSVTVGDVYKLIQEAKKEEREKFKVAFYDKFVGSGEVWFPYVGCGVENEQEEREAVDEHWEDILNSITTPLTDKDV
jgi:hypothetical protein